MDAPYAKLEELEPGIARVLAHNPSAFTYYGTQTYLIGTRELAIIDPGPDLPEHLDALMEAIGGRHVAAIMCTHTHRDHSPAARPLAGRTGAPIVGCAPLALETVGPRADASFDGEYVPDSTLEDGQEIAVDGKAVAAVATPGHTSNHLCFVYGDALFSGDHVMGWSTTVVVPPDGDMAEYMRSLDKLRAREDRIYYPAHGPAVTNPQQYVRHLTGHRMQRERQILKLLGERPRPVSDIVANAYPALDPRLVTAAGGSVFAHLLDLQRRGLVEQQGDEWTTA
ncbi:MAG TPA: MBL fold metallo-hydrolase [Sphingomicrobium sp.]|nr:MBL fold metallo-hydrolase [Sphingomicrobium sp.]